MRSTVFCATAGGVGAAGGTGVGIGAGAGAEVGAGGVGGNGAWAAVGGSCGSLTAGSAPAQPSASPRAGWGATLTWRVTGSYSTSTAATWSVGRISVHWEKITCSRPDWLKRTPPASG